MMNCDKALAACENNVDEATEFLRKKRLASAEQKAGRVASKGLICSYIDDGRVGVLMEVNSETNFVAGSERFKELVADLAMQVVSWPQVIFILLLRILTCHTSELLIPVRSMEIAACKLVVTLNQLLNQW